MDYTEYISLIFSSIGYRRLEQPEPAHFLQSINPVERLYKHIRQHACREHGNQVKEQIILMSMELNEAYEFALWLFTLESQKAAKIAFTNCLDEKLEAGLN